MKPMLILIAACGFAACITDPTPGRSAYCAYPGDTVAYSVVSLGGVAIVCDWTVSAVEACGTSVVKRYGQADCMEGQKWPRG